MSDRNRAIALLVRREIERTFADHAENAMVKVTCLEPEEIVPLVVDLRDWTPPAGGVLRVAVTANRPWEGLRARELVGLGEQTPTTLRNQSGCAVILIEGDEYTDQQSWRMVQKISDSGLLHDATARRALVAHFFRQAPPRLLADVVEEVHESIREEGDTHVPVRSWVDFVAEVCRHVVGRAPLDAGSVWEAIGRALPEAKLFPDDELATLDEIDRQRRLRRNRKDSHHLLFEAEDGWRDRLQERSKTVEFSDRDGNPEVDMASIRVALEKALGPDAELAQRDVLFRHWMEVVDAKRRHKGLGTRIRDHLAENHPERLAEFLALGVLEGIDRGEAEAARILLEDTTVEDRPPLVSLLTPKQVSALERMANPRAPSTRAPLIEILRVVAEMVSERAAVVEGSDQPDHATLVLEPEREPEEAEHSRALFAWLFGPTLERTVDELGNDALSFEVAPALLDTASLEGFEREPAHEDDEVRPGSFAALDLRLRWADDVGLERRIEWSPRDTPGLITLWRLTGHGEASTWSLDSDLAFDTWLLSSLQRAPMLGAEKPTGERTEIAERWGRTRSAAFEALHTRGLCPETLREYARSYGEMLDELRHDYVPAGAGRTEVDDILSLDLCTEANSAIMLASHPIRLRWVLEYLERSSELLVRAIRGRLSTNPVNPDLFFSELLSASPQAQPPATVVGDKLFVAVREQDWHEHFAPLKDERGERREWLADLDDGAIDDVADTIGRYLDAYPHKADGLHVLYIVRRQAARGLHRLIKRVRGRIKIPGASIALTLFVDPLEVRDVEEVLQDFDDADHRAGSDHPPLRVTLRHWENPQLGLPDLSDTPSFVDVAVVPNLFGASTRTHDGTREVPVPGCFDPLLDEPTRLEAVGSGDAPSAAVSRVLLPEAHDELLEAWSTVTTRQFRGSPIGDSPPREAVDFVTIRVSLDKNREFFAALHRCAHWVVTVDGFVGREQIEALDDGPEVIRVKTGVGANGAYRMVVSSKTGRDFVESRVAQRLRKEIPARALPEPTELAAEVYDRARLLVPGIVLRSLGLGRTAAEMVGLVIARARIEQKDPARIPHHGFQTWLSLDEHPEWSGGHQKLRADLARLRGWFDEDRLHLLVDVVEAKMRTHVAVGRADRQLSRSIALLRAGLEHTDGEGIGFADAPMWCRLVWRAIEQTSGASDATPAATHVVTPSGTRVGLDDSMRTALREGKIVVEDVRGVLVSMTDAEEAVDTQTPEGYRWLRMTLDEARSVLGSLRETRAFPLVVEDAPAERTRSDAEPPPEPQTSGVGTGTRSPSARPRTNDPSREDEPTSPSTMRGGASEAARERMQDLLNALFASKVEVQPEGKNEDALEGPGFFVLRVTLGPSVRPQMVEDRAKDLQYHLGLEAGQFPRIYSDRGAVVVEIPKRDDERYYVEAENMWQRTHWPPDSLYTTIGTDVRNEPVGIDFSSSRSPHLLIGGMTGGGKSVALETLLVGLIRRYPPDRLELRIIDPKGNEFTQFENAAHVREPLGMDAEDAIEMLEKTCEEMDERYRSMKRLARSSGQRIRDISAYNRHVDAAERFHWIVIVLDEFADLTSDKNDKKTIEGLLQRIAQKARACGIHAVVATQKPSVEVISTTTRSNLGAQLALRVRSSADSRVIMEETGAEGLAGNGDAFLRLSGGKPIRLQCAKVS